jgi:hypothetical protein
MTGGETPIAERQLLHAYRLTITLLSGERREFEAPLPGDFEHALHILRDGAG